MKTSDIFRIALKKILEKKGIKQNELALMIHQTPQQVCDFLSGRRNYKDNIREEIATNLGTTYTDMLTLGREIIDAERPRPDKSKGITGHSATRISLDDDDSITEKQAEYNIVPITTGPNRLHHELINRFKNKQSAYEANRLLLDIEATNPQAFERIIGYLEARLEELKKNIRPATRINGNHTDP